MNNRKKTNPTKNDGVRQQSEATRRGWPFIMKEAVFTESS
jgi:hypothetical protein